MKRIVLNPFDAASISHAIQELRDYKRWVRERVHKLCEVLAKDYALYTVADEFGYTEDGSVVCEAEEMPNGWIVRASGKAVFFLEYGTGPAALDGNGPILGTPPVSTAPGSYSSSEMGKGTYQDWLDGGGEAELGPYKWTIQPRAGMYYAFKAATEAVQKVAEEVFRS